MQNSAPFTFLTILLILLMAGAAILFPAALFMGFSYDRIVAVILILLIIVLALLTVLCSHSRRDEHTESKKGDVR